MPFSPALSAALARNSNYEGVRETKDLRRIRDLVRLDWPTLVDDLKGPVLAKAAKDLRPCRGGTVRDGLCSVCGTPLDLRPIQVAMLAYVSEFNGGFFPARTGAGKMLVSLLVPTMAEAKRPLLLVPASRVEPTYTAIAAYKKHWHLVIPYVLAYEQLSQAKHAETIQKLAPDCCTADEAQCLKDTGGSRWKRLQRHEGPCVFVPMSGSFANRSTTEWGHLAIKALGENAPVPLDWVERQEWDRALNRKASVPLEPGALLTLTPDPVPDGVVGFEAGCIQFGRRLVSCPGVVSSGFDVPDIPLTCSIKELPASPAIKEAAEHMIRTWETPCGYPFELALDLWRHLQECSAGMVQRWKDIPPRHWLDARKRQSEFYRAVIDAGYNVQDGGVYDTPGQIDIAVADGRVLDDGSLEGFTAVEDDYTPVTVPTWLCDSTLEYCAEWLARERGIVWTMHPEFGNRLSEMTGVPYYHDAGCDAQGRHIERSSGPVIASPRSCGVGQNLQQHNRNLIVTCPPSGLLEQVVSRTHRDGQKRPVHVEFLARLPSDLDTIAGCRADAVALGHSLQITQRIDYAHWL